MSLVDEFADFVGSVPYRQAELPWGSAQVWEAGEGRPVVLLHGIAGGRRLFFRLVPLLARHRRVIVAPLRGEDIADPQRDPRAYLDDIESLLAAFEVTDATLLGVSFGGYLALAYAARNDPRIADVVVQGGFDGFRLRVTDRATLWLSYLLPAALGSAYFQRRVLRGTESRLLAQFAPGLEVLLADWMGKTPFPSLRARTRMIAQHRIVGNIGVPLTLAQGRADRVVPFAYFERLRRRFPAARDVVWDDVAHNVALTHPERLAELILPAHPGA